MPHKPKSKKLLEVGKSAHGERKAFQNFINTWQSEAIRFAWKHILFVLWDNEHDKYKLNYTCLTNTSHYGSTSSIKGGEIHHFPLRFFLKVSLQNSLAISFKKACSLLMWTFCMAVANTGTKTRKQNLTPCCYL